ncbi:MAG TPA: hypothetical protein VK659_09745 [Asanoa sp.]|nr:hypothetical protein [Asanoa sp.]
MSFEIYVPPKRKPNGYACYRCGRPATRWITVGMFGARRMPVCDSNRH